MSLIQLLLAKPRNYFDATLLSKNMTKAVRMAVKSSKEVDLEVSLCMVLVPEALRSPDHALELVGGECYVLEWKSGYE